MLFAGFVGWSITKIEKYKKSTRHLQGTTDDDVGMIDDGGTVIQCKIRPKRKGQELEIMGKED